MQNGLKNQLDQSMEPTQSEGTLLFKWTESSERTTSKKNVNIANLTLNEDKDKKF